MTHMQITQDFPEALRLKEMKMVEEAIGGVVAAFFPLTNSLYFLAALSGIGLIIAPFIFGYGGVAAVSGILTGIAVAVLAGILTLRRS